MKKTEVHRLVDRFLGGLAKKYELSAEKVIQELCKLAFANMEDYVEVSPRGVASLSPSEMTRDRAAAIQEIALDDCTRGLATCGNGRRVVRLRLTDKVRCLELLGNFLR